MRSISGMALAVVVAFSLVGTLAACSGGGSDSDGNGGGGTGGTGGAGGTGGNGGTGGGGFEQPAGTVAVNFVVDDTANAVYGDGDLQWKGSMHYDAATRKITSDPTWSGPWATLYDDGPWTAGTPPGHEPEGSTAGDHRWGVTVFATPPAEDTARYEYGLVDTLYASTSLGGWIWSGANGTFDVAADATAPIEAQGLVFPAFGTTDLRVTIDPASLDPSQAWDTTRVGVQGSAWAWATQWLEPGTGGLATFTLSEVIGAEGSFPHSGLLRSGETVRLVILLGDAATEYRANGHALTAGVAAAFKAAGAADFTPTTIELTDSGDAFVTVP